MGSTIGYKWVGEVQMGTVGRWSTVKYSGDWYRWVRYSGWVEICTHGTDGYSGWVYIGTDG